MLSTMLWIRVEEGKRHMSLYTCMLSRFSHVCSVILWTVACQALLSMGLYRQECWSRLPCPPPGDLPDPGIEPASLSSNLLCQAAFFFFFFFTTNTTWEASNFILTCKSMQEGITQLQGNKAHRMRSEITVRVSGTDIRMRDSEAGGNTAA